MMCTYGYYRPERSLNIWLFKYYGLDCKATGTVKYYFRIFFHLFDVAVCNAEIVYKMLLEKKLCTVASLTGIARIDDQLPMHSSTHFPTARSLKVHARKSMASPNAQPLEQE